MSDSSTSGSHGTVLDRIIALGRVDSRLFRLRNERRQLESSVNDRANQLRKDLEVLKVKQQNAATKKQKYTKEEKLLRDENEKLVDRRKALTSLSNYKLQEAAGREIDAAAKALRAREDGLLKLLEESDAAEKDANTLLEKLTAEHAAIEKLMEEANSSVAGFEEQQSTLIREREAITSALLPDPLKQYQRIHDKYPMDPIVPVKGGTCSGCFMAVQPQTLIEMGKGEQLVRCRGCGRLLSPEAAPEAK